MEKVKEINNIGLNIKLQRKKNRLTQINTKNLQMVQNTYISKTRLFGKKCL